MPMCASGDGNEATFVGTMLQTGTGFTLCDECLVGWCAGLLQVMTGVDPAPFMAAISDDVAAPDGAHTPEGEAEAAEVTPIADHPAPADDDPERAGSGSPDGEEAASSPAETPPAGDAATPGP